MNKQSYLNYFKDNSLPPIHMIDRTLAEKSLKHFIIQAWPIVEPHREFVDGWHIDVICDHLEAVTNGEINKLIINIPPKHTKSLTVSVFWPCWEWINKPWIRWIFSSYAQKLSTRDSVKCRRIIQSEWYKSNWGDRFRLVGDQNEKIKYENSKTGYRLATSVDGLGTGEGGDRIVIDDPHNVMEGESETKRKSTLQWWDEEMSTRLDDINTGAKVIIQQRIHEEDLTGHVIEREGDYIHLCLPARYESDHPYRYDGDLRKEEGEPLCPERFNDNKLTELERALGQYAAAGQLQQRPSPRGGGMFRVEQFKIVNAIPSGQIVKKVRYWDKAGTEGGGAFSVGVLMYRMSDKTYIIPDVQRGQWSAGKREERIRQTAEIDGVDVTVWLEQEPGSSGKESADSTIKNLAGFIANPDRVTGSKETRARPYSAQVEAGNVYLIRGAWNRAFIDEHEKFPAGKYKDQVDASSGAFNKLVTSRQAGVLW